jgi:recombination protein J
MYKALEACRETLIQFGGHEMAAGLSVASAQLEEFRMAFSNYVRAHLIPADFIPKTQIEALVAPADWTLEMVEELELLEPYGMGNPRPIFGVRAIRPQSASAIGAEGKHLRMEIGTRENHVAALCWNAGELAEILTEEDSDLAYTPSINEWQGIRSVQCMAESVMPAEHERIFPDRALLKDLYRLLSSLRATNDQIAYNTLTLTRKFSEEMRHISHYTMECALHIFQELGLLSPLPEIGWQFIPPAGKLELMDAPTYRREQERKGDA